MSSGFNSPNPFGESNPYTSPISTGGQPGWDPRQLVKGKVIAPAIALIVIGVLGLAFAVFGVLLASGDPPKVDPNAPEFIRGFQQGQVGPTAIILQLVFVVLNGVIIFGGVQMMRLQMRPLAIAASVLAMVNIGNCCCIIGLPVGIWSLVILMGNDVIAAFDRSS